jgi:hypothetical protein
MKGRSDWKLERLKRKLTGVDKRYSCFIGLTLLDPFVTLL